MDKKTLKARLELLGCTQAQFLKLAKLGSRALSNYRDDDKLPDSYEGFMELLEENYALKSAQPDIKLLKKTIASLQLYVERLEKEQKSIRGSKA